MKPSRLLPRLLALCLLAAALPAEAWRLPDEAAARLAAGVPPPPDDASPAGLADLQTVLQVQAARTPEQAAAAASHAVRLPLDLVAPLFGTDLRDKLPRAAAFFSEVHKTGDRVVDRVKDTYRRPRPWQRSDDVQPCVYIPRGFSYPSGHSLNAALWAALWSEILPEYAAFFSAGIPSAMWNRVVGGAHYPSDTQAGALLGGQIAVEILKTPGVRDELAAIRAELDAVLAGQPAAVAAARRATNAARAASDPVRLRLRVVSARLAGAASDAVEAIRRAAPGVLCAQGGSPELLRQLAAALPGHARFDGGLSGDGAEFPVFFDKVLFEQTDGGGLRLSEAEDAGQPVLLTWLRLRDRWTGREFHILNTRFSRDAAEKAAALVEERLAPELPAVIAGESDAPAVVHRSPAFARFATRGYYDSFYAAKTREGGRGRDWILLRPAAGAHRPVVERAGVLAGTAAGKRAPVFADVVFFGAAAPRSAP